MENNLENVELNYTVEELGNKLEQLENKIKEVKLLQEQYDDFKVKMYEVMSKNNCDKYTSPNGIKFTRVAPSQDKTELKVEFDSNKFKEEQPEIYNKYLHAVEKVTKGKSGYVRISVPKEEN